MRRRSGRVLARPGSVVTSRMVVAARRAMPGGRADCAPWTAMHGFAVALVGGLVVQAATLPLLGLRNRYPEPSSIRRLSLYSGHSPTLRPPRTSVSSPATTRAAPEIAAAKSDRLYDMRFGLLCAAGF